MRNAQKLVAAGVLIALLAGTGWLIANAEYVPCEDRNYFVGPVVGSECYEEWHTRGNPRSSISEAPREPDLPDPCGLESVDCPGE